MFDHPAVGVASVLVAVVSLLLLEVGSLDDEAVIRYKFRVYVGTVAAISSVSSAVFISLHFIARIGG